MGTMKNTQGLTVNPNAHATVCRKGHDLTLPGATKLIHPKDRNWYRACAICWKNRCVAKQRAKTERDRKARAERRAREQQFRAMGVWDPGSEQDPAIARDAVGSGPSIKDDKSPFSRSLVALEQHWGLPWAQWTKRHHEAHTRLMYRMLGWPESGPPSGHEAVSPRRKRSA